MQRRVRGCRAGNRIGATHLIRNHRHNDDNQVFDQLSEANANLNKSENKNCDNNSTAKSQASSVLSSTAINDDFESVISNLRPLKINQKRTKDNSNIYSQKSSSSQLNMKPNRENKVDEKHQDKKSHYLCPKYDVVYAKPNNSIRHHRIESPQTNEKLTPPALLTTIPPADILTRPTAVIAQTGATRSMSAYFSSKSSIKDWLSHNIDDFPNDFVLKSNQSSTKSFLKQAPSSAFQPISSLNSLLPDDINRRSTANSERVRTDILKHKPLERGQKLTKVHISHPQSPSIVHLMLHEDFNRACNLLHQMSAHSELQSNYKPDSHFTPEINQICTCCHEDRWFRCRVLEISSDLSTATVNYLDWGMTIQVKIKSEYIRRLPYEFFTETACSVMCHLDGVSNVNESIPSNVIAQCINLLSENEYEVIVKDYNTVNGGKIILINNGKTINDQIEKLISPYKSTPFEEELVEQFQPELKLSIGDEFKALLSSFSGKDDSFYVLIIDDNTAAIDEAISTLQENHIPDREYLQVPQIKTLVVARYIDDQKYYRAWVKSVNLEQEEALVFFVDFGNECQVSFSDIYICPESIRSLPWLGVRVRLTGETVTPEELTTFWKLTESHYIWIRINEIFKDSYGVQIKIDYAVYLQQQRLKSLTSKRFLHKALQVNVDGKTMFPRNSSEIDLYCLTSTKDDRNQIANENLLVNLFEMVNKELRLLRQRINNSDETSQDRHDEMIQLLLSIIDPNNSNNQSKI